jgi:hypothetical protein
VFTGVKADLPSQMIVLRDLLKVIDEREKASASDVVAKVMKGLFFVYAYAMYESVVVRSFSIVIADVNQQAISHADLQPSMLPLALAREFQSVSEVARTKTWRRRSELIARIACADVVHIEEHVFPDDGSHYRAKQLDTIWEILGLASNPTIERRHRGRIDELVENRNAVAHGREFAESIGGRYTVSELTSCADDYEQIAVHLVASFEELTNLSLRYRR